MRLRHLVLGCGASLSLLLAACGGGGNDAARHMAAMMPAPLPAGTHQVQLPATSDLLNIEMVDQPDLDLPEVAANAGQLFQAKVPTTWANSLLLLRLRQRDAEAHGELQSLDTTVEGSAGSPGVTVAEVLVMGDELNNGSVTFSPLTDYIGRRLAAYSDRLSVQRLRHFQDALSAELIARDITGDGVVDYRDALAFNPGHIVHRAALNFDYDAAVNRPFNGGRSLMQRYAGHPGEVAEALLEIFDEFEAVALPALSEAQSTVARVEIDVDYGGTVRIDELPDVLLDEENPRLVRRMEMVGPTQTLTLRAQAAEGMRFVRWAGCPQDQGNGVCVVTGDQDRFVGAQFGLDGEELVDGVAGVLKLNGFGRDAFDTQLGTQGELTIYNLTGDAALAAQMSQLGTDWVVFTGNWRYPYRRVTQVLPAAGGAGAVTLQTEEVELHDVYYAFSDFELDEQPTLDDVQQVRVSLDDSGQPALSMLTPSPDSSNPSGSGSNVLSRSVSQSGGLEVARAAPEAAQAVSRRVWIVGHGEAVDAGNGYYLVQNQQGPGFQVIRAQGSVQELSGQAAASALALSCTNTPLGPDCLRLSRSNLRASTVTGLAAGASGFTFPLGEVTIGSTKDTLLTGKFKATATLEFESLHSSMTFLWTALPPGADLRAASRGNFKVTLEIDAFVGVMGEKDFAKSLSQKACGKSPPIATAKPKGSPQSMADNAGSSDGDLLPGLDDLDIGDMDLDKDIKPMGINFCNGDQPSAGGAGSTQVLSPNRLRIAVQLNPAWMGGAVAPLRFGVGLSATAKGQAGLKGNMKLKLVFPYDNDISLGSKCERKGKKTSCDRITKLKKPQRLEGRTSMYHNTKWSLGLTANAQFAPGLDASFTWGPRGINEELVQIGAAASLPLKLVGSMGMLSSSNFPEDVAAKVPEYCAAAYTYALGLGWQVDLYATINPKIKVGKFISFGLKSVDIVRKTISGDILPPKLFAGKRGQIITDDMAACAPLNKRAAKYFPESYSWGLGDFKWNQPSMVLTQNRKLVLQEDGNLVLYALTRSGGGTGGIVGEKAVWASNTYGRAGARVHLQPDGNLVVYDLLERPQFASGTHGNPGARLQLLPDGKLVIVNSSGKVIWSAG